MMIRTLGCLMRRILSLCIVILLLTACRAAEPAVQPLPTVARLPSAYRLEDAERVALNFLDAWRAADTEAMYALIAVASQEAAPYSEFETLYRITQDEMTFAGLDYVAMTSLREADEVAVVSYDVTFRTRLLGEFTDVGRQIRLVVDSSAQDWRVAWTAADVFPEMIGGARVRFDPVIPNRANIYARDRVTTLADQQGRVAVVRVIRQDIPDYPGCLGLLSATLNRPVEEIQSRIEARPPYWLMDIGIIEAQRFVETQAVLEATCAAQFGEQPARRYNTDARMPHILGYVGYSDASGVPALEAAGFPQDAIVGRSGIEASWDETLRGRPGGRLVIVTPDGEVVRELSRITAQPGQSVYLTIDPNLQVQVAQILADAYTQAKDTWAARSNGAAIVVMDVNTGEILSMVSYPSFDNNAYTPFPTMGRDAAQQVILANTEDPRRPELNRATQGTYPLGSVMKTVTDYAALNEGVFAPDFRFSCYGTWSRDIPRTDWLAGGHGMVNPGTALTQSCNPFFYEAGYMLDTADPWILPNYSRAVGFGAPTGMLDLAEEAGNVQDPDWKRITFGFDWSFSDAVNMAIGQGELLVTPIQVVRWTAAIANGGTLYRPQLVREVGLLGDTLTMVSEPDSMEQLDFQPNVLETLQQGMCDVTSTNFGTAEFVFRDSPLQALGVCGKTGTAQAGGDGTLPPFAWFASWAPRDNPQIAVIVMVENAGEGSGVAAPIARQVLEAYFFGEPVLP
jgi:penicillin-binding protein 2